MATKIIIFPGNFLPHMGGLETHVDELAKYLSKKDYEITIFAPNSGGKEKETIHNKVKVIRYPTVELVSHFSFPKVWSPKFWNLFSKLFKQDYDIVMTRTRFFPNTFLGLWLAKFRIHRIKLVHVEHGSSFIKSSSIITVFFSRLWDETIARILFLSADKVVSISSAVSNFLKYYTKKKLPLIPRGIDFEKYEKLKPLQDKRLKNKIVLCSVGRFYSWKGFDNAIQAFNALPERIKKRCVYVIAGYGAEEKKLKELAGNKIIFLGKISHETAIRLFKASDIYVHSSFPGGGLSSALMQSMRSGCVSVASPHEGAKDIVTTSNGILLKNNSIDNLEKGMTNLILANRSKKSKEAINKIKKEYSWEEAIKKYDKLFKSILP